MPKKTKREKIIADYRKKMKALEMSTHTSTETLRIEKTEHSKSLTIQSAKVKTNLPIKAKSTAEIDFSKEKSYITHDLVKSLALSSLAIVSLVVIYFGSHT